MSRLKGLIILLFCTFLMGSAIGCTSTMDKVVEMKYTEWTSEDADIYFRTLDSYGNGYGYVTINNVKENAFFEIISKERLLIHWLEETPLGNYSSKERCPISVKYNDGVITSTAKTPINIFGTEYSSFSLTKAAVNRDTIDVGEYMAVNWQDANGYLSFYIDGINPNKVGEGKAIIDGIEQEVVFIWGNYNTFKIYLGRFYYANTKPENAISDNALPIAGGTYISAQKKATLLFTYDDLFNFTFSELTINAETLTEY